jgi:hypothetical protein
MTSTSSDVDPGSAETFLAPPGILGDPPTTLGFSSEGVDPALARRADALAEVDAVAPAAPALLAKAPSNMQAAIKMNASRIGVRMSDL